MAADTVVGGLAATDNAVSNERPTSHGQLLYLRNPAWAPFQAMLTRLSNEGTLTDIQHTEWAAKDLPRRTTLSGTHNDSTTTINVATGTGAYFRAGTVFKATRTGEQFLVSSLTTDALTVATRPWGTTSAATLVADDPVIIIAQTAAQGASAPAAAAPVIQSDSNYSQIIREPIYTARTLRQTSTRPGNKKDQTHTRNIKFALRAVQEQLNRTAYFGEPKLDTTGSTPRTFAGGILHYVTLSSVATWANAAGGNLINATGQKFDPDIFHAIAAKTAAVGGNGLMNKVCFVGPAIMRRASQILTNAGTIRSDEAKSKKYGFPVKTFATNFGDLTMVLDYQLCGSGGPNVTNGATAWDAYGSYIVCVDFDHLKMKWMQPLILRRNIQAPDIDGTMDEYLCEFTIVRRLAESHCIAYGFVG